MVNFPEKIWIGRYDDICVLEIEEEEDLIEIYDDARKYIRADLVPQWQPIETMPANVDVFLMTPKRVAYVGSFNGHYDIRLQSIPGLFDKTHFTHWMPIPKEPEWIKNEKR